MAETNFNISIPSWLEQIYNHKYTYIICTGGRDSGKTFSLVEYILYQSYCYRSGQFLIGRETLTALRSTLFMSFVNAIRRNKISSDFEIKTSLLEIVNIRSGLVLTFKGMHHNHDAIKGLENLHIIFIDEGQYLSKESLAVLTPTGFRKKKGLQDLQPQFIVAMNPLTEQDVIYKKYLENKESYGDSLFHSHTTYRDNPAGISDATLKEIEALKRNNYEEYLHVYEGEFLRRSEAVIFKQGVNWVIEDFTLDEREDENIVYGLDFGFAKSPVACIRCVIREDIIYVTHELYKHELRVDAMYEELVNTFPDIKDHCIYADSSSPLLINYLYNRGLRIIGAKKSINSVEQGISFLKTFKSVLHPTCTNLSAEFSKYSYKTNIHGDITNIPLKEYDHGIDGMRYAIEPMMISNGLDYDSWIESNMVL